MELSKIDAVALLMELRESMASEGMVAEVGKIDNLIEFVLTYGV